MTATGQQAGRQTNRNLVLFHKNILKFSEEVNLLHLKHTSTLSANQEGQNSKEFRKNALILHKKLL
jgi:hypothetical protein